jgi:hypothetical protein
MTVADIALEVPDLNLAYVTCVMRTIVEVCDDSLMPAVFIKSISEISVAFPIFGSPFDARECWKIIRSVSSLMEETHVLLQQMLLMMS